MNHLLPEILYGEIDNFESVIKDYLDNNKGFLIADQNTINCRALISSSVLLAVIDSSNLLLEIIPPIFL